MDLYKKGKRGLVYKEGNVIIKVEREDIQAVNRIKNESDWLKKLNKVGIGPKHIKFVKNKLYMEFIDGEIIMDMLKMLQKKI